MRNYSILAFCILLLHSCQSYQSMTIDYLLPAEVNFPTDLRRVAVVNNAPLAETSIATNENQFILGAKPEVKTYKGNAFFTTESLAEALAEANYFDEVIVCDSILRASDTELRTDPTLTRNEVIQLAQELDVDFIMAVEDVSLQTSNYLTFIPEWNCFQGVVNMKVSPKINVYIPNRSIPLFAVNARDSIYWEQLGTTESYVRGNIIKKDQFIREGSIFAGIAPIKHLLPHWNSATRYLYTSGSVHMRDATIYLNENNWEEAFKLWNETYQKSKNKKLKMKAANNIAVYYELNDNFTKSIEWAQKAEKLAYEIDKIEHRDLSNSSLSQVENYVLTFRYVEELKKREAGLSLLNLQMKRIHEDF